MKRETRENKERTWKEERVKKETSRVQGNLAVMQGSRQGMVCVGCVWKGRQKRWEEMGEKEKKVREEKCECV